MVNKVKQPINTRYPTNPLGIQEHWNIHGKKDELNNSSQKLQKMSKTEQKM